MRWHDKNAQSARNAQSDKTVRTLIALAVGALASLALPLTALANASWGG